MPNEGYAGFRIQKEILIYEARAGELDRLCRLIADTAERLTLYRTSRIEEAYRIFFERNLTLIIIMLMFKRNCEAEGLDLVHTIKSCGEKAFIPLILVTKEELSLSHFLGDLHCYGILDTEYQETYAKKLLGEALRFPAVLMQKEFAYFKKSGEICRIRIADVMFSEHHKKYTIIHTFHGTLEIGACSCQEIISKFEAYDFLVCARGIVVNMMSVEIIDQKKRRLYFEGRVEWIEYGINYAAQIREYLMWKGV